MSLSQSFAELKKIKENRKLAGSWLVTGAYGVGKSTLVRRFSSWLLTGKEEDISYHPNLKWVERGLTEEEKKDLIKTLNEGKVLDEQKEQGRSRKDEITIDEIREGLQFLSLTSSGNSWRILVIDTADEMNENAAHALLKSLEEPPRNAIIFLISHNMGRLLPTIRSRCRILKVTPASDAEIKDFVRSYAPQIENPDMLLPFAMGSIGRCKDMIDCDGLSLYQMLLEMMEHNNHLQIYDFCEKVSKDQKLYFLAKDLISFYLSSLVKASYPQKDVDFYLKLWEEVQRDFKDIEDLNMDKKNALANIFFKIGRKK